jgi:hypothetical protein
MTAPFAPSRRPVAGAAAPERVSPLRILVVTGLASLVVLTTFFFYEIRFANSVVYGMATPLQMIEGTASRPFQYRVLIPLLVRWADAVGLLANAEIGLAWADLVAIFGIFTLGLVLLRVFRLRLWWFPLLPAILFADYAGPWSINYGDCWDMPAILFFMIGILTIRYRIWWALYPVLALGVLNRETAALLTPLFMLVEWRRMERRRFFLAVGCQFGLIAAVKVALYVAYRHNPGCPVEFVVNGCAIAPFLGAAAASNGTFHGLHLVQNLGFIATGRMAALFAGLWLPMLFGGRHIADPWLRRARWVVAVEFAVMLAVGNLVEYRLFNECVPIVFLAVAASLDGSWTTRYGARPLRPAAEPVASDAAPTQF